MTETSRETIGAPWPEPRLDVAARLLLGFGLCALCVVGGLALGLACAIWLRRLSAFVAGLALGLGAGGLAALTLAFHDLLNALERWTGADLNNDGRIGGGDGLVLLRARNAPDGDEQVRDELRAFLAGCLIDTSARRWEPELGRQRYQEWRDMLIGGGYARWKGSDQRTGWELMATPDEIMARLG